MRSCIYVCLCPCCLRAPVFMLCTCACVHVACVRLCSCCVRVLLFMLHACACVHAAYVRLCPCCLRVLVFMLHIRVLVFMLHICVLVFMLHAYAHDSVTIVYRDFYLCLCHKVWHKSVAQAGEQ